MATRSSKADDPARAIEVLWGAQAPPRRGPKRTLTAEKIAHAAIQVADREGLPALSMQRVAAELGFTTMSIYNHIPSKDLLLEVMMDVAAGDPPDLTEIDDWRAAVRQWARDLWTSFEARPWVLRIPVEKSPRGPHQLAWFDGLLTQLLRGGLPPNEARGAALYILSSVRGTAQTALALTDEDPASQADSEVGRLMSEVLDPDRFPGLAMVMGPSDSGPDPTDTLQGALGFGLDRLLDGIEAWVARSDT